MEVVKTAFALISLDPCAGNLCRWLNKIDTPVSRENLLVRR